MSESRQEKAPVSKQFLLDLGFELPDEAISFYVEDSKIVFNIQDIEEVGCSFVVREVQEEFPLSEEQLKKIRDAGYDSPEGFLIL